MDNKIFEQQVTSVNLSSSSSSFKDCPNKCIDGFYVNPYTHRKIKCDYCEGMRKKFVKEGLKDIETDKSIKEILRLPDSFIGMEFDAESVIPKFALKDMKDESITSMKNILNELICSISLGDLPSHSMMFNLGKKAFENNFIYAYLIRSYLAGRVTSPLVSSWDLCRLRNLEEHGVEDRNSKDTFSSYINSDVCIVVIDSGATYLSINAVKGLMQLRANRGKSTIIFTNAWGTQIYDLCSEGDEVCKNLARLYSIEYTDEYISRERNFETSKESNRGTPRGYNNSKVFGMSNEDFNSLMSPTSNM